MTACIQPDPYRHAKMPWKKGLTMKTVILKDGTHVPAVGQGTWFMGEKPSKRKKPY
jgi:hypothetical protein